MTFNPKKCIGILYCALTLLLLAFVNYDGATAFYAMVVPYIEGHVIVIHFILAAVFAIVLFLSCLKGRKFIVDSVSVGLMIKCIVDAIPFLKTQIDTMDYFWHWSCTAASLITYIIMINCNIDYKNRNVFKKMLLLFAYVLCGQVVYTALFCGYQYLDIQYKIAMVIPYGGSNIIATALVPGVLLSFYFINSKRVKWCSIIVILSGIVLTKSRGAILYVCFALFVCLFVHNKQNGKTRINNLWLIFAVLCLSGALISDEGFLTLMQGFAKGSNNITLAGWTSGRSTLWAEMLSAMFDTNLLFGVGMKSLSGHSAGAHNVLIDMFYKGGFVGGLNYLIVLLTLIRAALKNMKKGLKSFAVMTLLLIGNMMFEVNYFSYSCDVFFWLIAGLMMKESYQIKSSQMEQAGI
ncbi:O-antigen ligase family protein [Pygmaiobacter massiliensis]|uniref:O-antigen ligase family protein n=1 Tax=Pygmaiobacter massiliensis TaxID=1917873 RepID=UPI000C7CD41A|nr:O-antigen ligase family protein [Pygmaiobacter massiliensis]